MTSSDAPPRAGKEVRRKKAKKEDVEEMMRAASRAAHAARDKGFYTVSHEATTCVHLLRRLKELRLSPSLISGSDITHTLRFLAKNGNPMIRSEARSVLDHLGNILSSRSPKKQPTQKTELLECCDALKNAAAAVKAGVYSSQDSRRLVETLERLLQVPRDLARDVVDSTDIRASLASLAEHGQADVRNAARSLVDSWRIILYSSDADTMKRKRFV